jgi:hypothetical protein
VPDTKSYHGREMPCCLPIQGRDRTDCLLDPLFPHGYFRASIFADTGNSPTRFDTAIRTVVLKLSFPSHGNEVTEYPGFLSTGFTTSRHGSARMPGRSEISIAEISGDEHEIGSAVNPS